MSIKTIIWSGSDDRPREKAGLRIRRGRCWPAAVIGLLFVGCGVDDPRDDGWTGTISTLPNGASLISNPAEGLWPAGAQRRLVEELRIGSVDGAGPESFGEVRAVDVDALGRIWVLDHQAQEIRVFDQAGGYVRTVGRRGSGPGELGFALGMTFDSEQRIWLPDVGNARFSVFDSAGTFLETRPRPEGFAVLPWQGRFDTSGHLWDYAMSLGATPLDSELALVRRSADLNVADTFRLPTFERPRWEHAEGLIRADIPFTPAMIWALGDSGELWWGVSDRYRFVHSTPDRDTARVVERQWQPEQIPRAVREEALERMGWFTRQGGEVRLADVPSEAPAFSAILPNPTDGTVWIVQFIRPGQLAQSFDVFDEDGRFLGTAITETGLLLSPRPVLRGNHVYGVTRDDLGVHYVVHLTLEE